MNLKNAREEVETHLRWLCNRGESWRTTPVPENVQEAMCLLILSLTDDKGAAEALAEEFRPVITHETPT